ncbi:hypothetical protein CS022_10570 [Veronia nyctiphanis]|uniref:Uncharacterized protein n=1 Tax=Veronia nyctiphanis TaxID=1278244 RepID=A0A4Q0YW11_9GAMM|nr:hypothetical protein CS022_10570 [Veronia nyctiphanis]
MFKYDCTECGHKFDSQSLYCEDWSNPERKLGCPNCKTFFREKVAVRVRSNLAIVSGVLACTVMLYFFMTDQDSNTSLAFTSLAAGYAVYRAINRIICGSQNRLILEPIKANKGSDES